MGDARIEAAAHALATHDGYVWPDSESRGSDRLANAPYWFGCAEVALNAADEVERGLADQLAAVLQQLYAYTMHHTTAELGSENAARRSQALVDADNALRAARGSSVRTQETSETK